MVRFQRYIIPALAAMLVIAITITLVIFSHSSSHSLVADAPTATPIATATPIPTDMPLPTATPVPTNTPKPTATPTPGKLIVTKGAVPDISQCPIPEMETGGSTSIEVTNTGGKRVYWTGPTTDPMSNPASGSVAPHVKASIGFLSANFSQCYGVEIAWSDHDSASGILKIAIDLGGGA